MPRRNETAAALAAKGRRIRHTCSVCGGTLVGLKTAVYSSNKCCQTAKRERAPGSLN